MAALLAYLVSFRRHVGFPDALVERTFADTWHTVPPERLQVWAQSTRRGGLAIDLGRASHPTPAVYNTYRQQPRHGDQRRPPVPHVAAHVRSVRDLAAVMGPRRTHLHH